MPVPSEPAATTPLQDPSATGRADNPLGSDPTERLQAVRDEAPPSSAPATRRSTPRPPPAPGTDVRVPPHARIPEVAVEIKRTHAPTPPAPPDLVPGFDLEDDEARDVAPIAATTAFFPQPPATAPSDRPPVAGPDTEPTVEELERQIQELEARLDRMMQRERRNAPTDEDLERDAVVRDRATADLGAAQTWASSTAPAGAPQGGSIYGATDVVPEPSPSGSMLETARELLSTDYVLRQWGKLGLRNRSEEVDEFGLDPKYEARFLPMLDFLYDVWFRVDTDGAGNLPDEGRCIVVANHSGGPLPYDGLMLRTTVRREHARRRDLRWLAEDFIYYLPFVGAFMNRVGAVRACQENAERLLSRGRAIAVFPEGAKGIGKLYQDRYRLQRFGRGGFIKLCLRTQTPLVPCAIVGAEESSPMLYKVEHLAKAFGIPYLPVTPTFPAFGPLGLLPAPTKWKVRFGDAMRFDEYGPEAADDDVLVARLTERVRTTIQGMLDRTVAARRSIWFG